MKSKHKRGKAALSLDFVTARSYDECQSILEREGMAHFWPVAKDQVRGQADTQLKFLLECPVHFDSLKSWKKRWRERTCTITIQVEGSLTPVRDGTHVVALIPRSTRRTFLNWQLVRLAGIGLVALIFACAVLITLSFALQLVAFVLLLMLISGVVLVTEMLLAKVHQLPVDVIARITRKLYLPPTSDQVLSTAERPDYKPGRMYEALAGLTARRYH